jgi:hypothetical protein
VNETLEIIDEPPKNTEKPVLKMNPSYEVVETVIPKKKSSKKN